MVSLMVHTLVYSDVGSIEINEEPRGHQGAHEEEGEETGYRPTDEAATLLAEADHVRIGRVHVHGHNVSTPGMVGHGCC